MPPRERHKTDLSSGPANSYPISIYGEKAAGSEFVFVPAQNLDASRPKGTSRESDDSYDPVVGAITPDREFPKVLVERDQDSPIAERAA